VSAGYVRGLGVSELAEEISYEVADAHTAIGISGGNDSKHKAKGYDGQETQKEFEEIAVKHDYWLNF
jgi:hypothetical protein